MSIACYLDRGRPEVSALIALFREGCGGRLVERETPDPDASDHAVVAKTHRCKLVPKFRRQKLPFLYLDSAFVQIPGQRYYRIERSAYWPPADMGEHTMERAISLGYKLQPWRKTGRNALILCPGPMAAADFGVNMRRWNEAIVQAVSSVTDRPIIIRHKVARETRPLEEDLRHAWCCITHSSTAAIEAVIAGVPVFCEPTCAAAPVARLDLVLESPVYPDREPWLASIAWRQWSREEIRSGTAWAHVRERDG